MSDYLDRLRALRVPSRWDEDGFLEAPDPLWPLLLDVVEAAASAQTSLATGPGKDGYAYAVLDDALAALRKAVEAA